MRIAVIQFVYVSDQIIAAVAVGAKILSGMARCALLAAGICGKTMFMLPIRRMHYFGHFYWTGVTGRAFRCDRGTVMAGETFIHCREIIRGQSRSHLTRSSMAGKA